MPRQLAAQHRHHGEAHPATRLRRTRRALIRLQAAQITRKIVDELSAQPAPGRTPGGVRASRRADRPLRGARRRAARPARAATDVPRNQRAPASTEARHDGWLRRELDTGQTARAHRPETGRLQHRAVRGSRETSR